VPYLIDDESCKKYAELPDCDKNSPPPIKDGVYALHSERLANDCLDLPSQSKDSPGANLQHNGCNGTEWQGWRFTRDRSTGCYDNKQDDKRCMDVASETVNNTGGKVQWNTCNSLGFQRFKVIPGS
jgi:hypothetical protein